MGPIIPRAPGCFCDALERNSPAILGVSPAGECVQACTSPRSPASNLSIGHAFKRSLLTALQGSRPQLRPARRTALGNPPSAGRSPENVRAHARRCCRCLACSLNVAWRNRSMVASSSESKSGGSWAFSAVFACPNPSNCSRRWSRLPTCQRSNSD